MSSPRSPTSTPYKGAVPNYYGWHSSMHIATHLAELMLPLVCELSRKFLLYCSSCRACHACHQLSRSGEKNLCDFHHKHFHTNPSSSYLAASRPSGVVYCVVTAFDPSSVAYDVAATVAAPIVVCWNIGILLEDRCQCGCCCSVPRQVPSSTLEWCVMTDGQ